MLVKFFCWLAELSFQPSCLSSFWDTSCSGRCSCLDAEAMAIKATPINLCHVKGMLDMDSETVSLLGE